MRDDPFSGGSFHSDDRRVYRKCARPDSDAEIRAHAIYALGRSVTRDLGSDFLRRTMPEAVAGPTDLAVTCALDRITSDPAMTSEQRRFASMALGAFELGIPASAVFDRALELKLRESAQARINKLQQHAASITGPGARAARACAERASRIFSEAAGTHELRHLLRHGDRVARPAIRPVIPDEVIA